MHQTIFTTSHVQLGDVYRVHWLRYALHELMEHASHRRINRLARHFQVSISDFQYTQQHYELHAKYRGSIDFEGAPSITDCLFGCEEVTPSIFDTKMVCIYDHQKMIACGYFDVGRKSAASILHFYDPDYSRYSLGKHLILLTVNYLKQNGYTQYYPGYVVEGNSKMDYKFFLDKEKAQYFDPMPAEWKYWDKA